MTGGEMEEQLISGLDEMSTGKESRIMSCEIMLINFLHEGWWWG
jgi:hypothetical protein